jgi:2-dehydro-3-deoxyphosphogluconate aldolase/(4S)-4-hydroxy-2-oxoglutarate aldolase
MLSSFAGPFPDVKFCPTGGISQATVRSYLDLPNVLCAGGSWLTPAEAVSKRDWGLIESLAAKAAASRD